MKIHIDTKLLRFLIDREEDHCVTAGSEALDLKKDAPNVIHNLSRFILEKDIMWKPLSMEAHFSKEGFSDRLHDQLSGEVDHVSDELDLQQFVSREEGSFDLSEVIDAEIIKENLSWVAQNAVDIAAVKDANGVRSKFVFSVKRTKKFDPSSSKPLQIQVCRGAICRFLVFDYKHRSEALVLRGEEDEALQIFAMVLNE